MGTKVRHRKTGLEEGTQDEDAKMNFIVVQI